MSTQDNRKEDQWLYYYYYILLLLLSKKKGLTILVPTVLLHLSEHKKNVRRI